MRSWPQTLPLATRSPPALLLLHLARAIVIAVALRLLGLLRLLLRLIVLVVISPALLGARLVILLLLDLLGLLALRLLLLVPVVVLFGLLLLAPELVALDLELVDEDTEALPPGGIVHGLPGGVVPERLAGLVVCRGRGHLAGLLEQLDELLPAFLRCLLNVLVLLLGFGDQALERLLPVLLRQARVALLVLELLLEPLVGAGARDDHRLPLRQLLDLRPVFLVLFLEVEDEVVEQIVGRRAGRGDHREVPLVRVDDVREVAPLGCRLQLACLVLLGHHLLESVPSLPLLPELLLL